MPRSRSRHRLPARPNPHRGARMSPLLAIVLIGAIAVLVVPMCSRQDAAGRPAWQVERVHDGDTLTCLDEAGRPWKIRLLGIDAPEQGQTHGDAARRALVAKLAGGRVRVEGTARDQHGRLLATLWIDDRNLNRELVAEGWAWAFGGFAQDPDLMAAEASARRRRIGLWADERPIPPRQWRDAHPREKGVGSHFPAAAGGTALPGTAGPGASQK